MNEIIKKMCEDLKLPNRLDSFALFAISFKIIQAMSVQELDEVIRELKNEDIDETIMLWLEAMKKIKEMEP